MDGPQRLTGPQAATDQERHRAFTRFFHGHIADDGSPGGGIAGYRAHVVAWVMWCQSRGLNPVDASPSDVRAYRRSLVAADTRPPVIAHKLAVMRRFYQALQAAGLREGNPAAGIFPSDAC